MNIGPAKAAHSLHSALKCTKPATQPSTPPEVQALRNVLKSDDALAVSNAIDAMKNFSSTSLTALTVGELKAMLKSLKLPVSGVKAVLADRVADALKEKPHE